MSSGLNLECLDVVRVENKMRLGLDRFHKLHQISTRQSLIAANTAHGSKQASFFTCLHNIISF